MKYRLYDKQRNKMIYPEDEVGQCYDVEIYMDGSFSVARKYKKEGMGYKWWVEKSKGFELMRSIGLENLENQTFFEDDIVKLWNKVGVVKYDEENTTYKIYGIKNGEITDSWYELSYRTIPEIEIIGNIHENPELLEE